MNEPVAPKKRLLIFDHAAYLPSGDSPQRHYELAQKLGKLGVSTTLIGSGFDHRSRRQIRFKWYQLWRSQTVDGVRYVWLRLPAYKHFRMRMVNMALYPVVATLCVASGYLGRADCMLGSSPHMFAPIAARIASMLTRSHFVLEIRDLWPDSIVQVLGVRNDSVPIRFMRWLEQRLFERADRVVSVLPGIGRYVEERGFALKQPPVWIANGVNLEAIPSAATAPDSCKVVYFGAIGPANFLERLLSIWQHVEKASPTARLEIIGDGPSLPALATMREALGLERVSFLGFMRNKQELYAGVGSAAAFIICVPDRDIYKYGVGANKIAEYLALGRPIVYLGEGLAEDIRTQPFVLAAGSSEPVQEVAASIANFLEQAKTRHELDARLARETARNNYSYELMARRLYEVCFSGGPSTQAINVRSAQ